MRSLAAALTFLLSAVAGAQAFEGVETCLGAETDGGMAGAHQDVTLAGPVGTYSADVNYDGRDNEADGFPDRRAALLRFALDPKAAALELASATLVVEVNNGSRHPYELYALKRAWDPDVATWNTASRDGGRWGGPGATSEMLDVYPEPIGVLYAPDLGRAEVQFNDAGLAAVRSWMQSTAENHGVIVRDLWNLDGLDFDNGSAGVTAPELIVVGQDGGVATFKNGAGIPVAYAGQVDTTIISPQPENLNGHGLAVGETQTPPSRSLLKFDVGAIPDGARIVSAELRLYVVHTDPGPVRFYEVLRPWSETAASYTHADNGAPWNLEGATGLGDQDDTVLAEVRPHLPGPVTAGLTDAGFDLIKEWIHEERDNNGYLLRFDVDDSSMAMFVDREYPEIEKRPKLCIRYVPPEVTLDACGCSSASGAVGAMALVIALAARRKKLGTGCH